MSSNHRSNYIMMIRMYILIVKRSINLITHFIIKLSIKKCKKLLLNVQLNQIFIKNIKKIKINRFFQVFYQNKIIQI